MSIGVLIAASGYRYVYGGTAVQAMCVELMLERHWTQKSLVVVAIEDLLMLFYQNDDDFLYTHRDVYKRRAAALLGIDSISR